MRPFLIICSQRSGSHLLHAALQLAGFNAYPEQSGFLSYEMIANSSMAATRPDVRDSRIIFEHMTSRWIEVDEWPRELLRRMDILKQADYPVIRLLPYHYTTFPAEVQDHLVREYDAVVLKRRDVKAAFLSLCHASATGNWISRSVDAANITPSPRRIEQRDFDTFVSSLRLRKKVSSRFNVKAEIYYETFEDNLHALEHIFETSFNGVAVPFVKNTRDYSWVENIDEVDSWFWSFCED
jgi:LPS sulfotransferase NodH